MKKLIVLFLIVGVVGTVAYRLNPNFRGQTDALLMNLGLRASSKNVFKWKDENGVLQYTQEKPSEGVSYKEVEARSDVTVLPPIDRSKP